MNPVAIVREIYCGLAASFLFFVSGVFAMQALADEFKPSRTDLTMSVTIQPFPSAAALREHCANLGVRYRGEGGCARVFPDSKRCEIYVVLPRNSDDAERERLVGHEALHCFFGHYHAKSH